MGEDYYGNIALVRSEDNRLSFKRGNAKYTGVKKVDIRYTDGTIGKIFMPPTIVDDLRKAANLGMYGFAASIIKQQIRAGALPLYRAIKFIFPPMPKGTPPITTLSTFSFTKEGTAIDGIFTTPITTREDGSTLLVCTAPDCDVGDVIVATINNIAISSAVGGPTIFSGVSLRVSKGGEVYITAFTNIILRDAPTMQEIFPLTGYEISSYLVYSGSWLEPILMGKQIVQGMVSDDVISYKKITKKVAPIQNAPDYVVDHYEPYLSEGVTTDSMVGTVLYTGGTYEGYGSPNWHYAVIWAAQEEYVQVPLNTAVTVKLTATLFSPGESGEIEHITDAVHTSTWCRIDAYLSAFSFIRSDVTRPIQRIGYSNNTTPLGDTIGNIPVGASDYCPGFYNIVETGIDTAYRITYINGSIYHKEGGTLNYTGDIRFPFSIYYDVPKNLDYVNSITPVHSGGIDRVCAPYEYFYYAAFDTPPDCGYRFYEKVLPLMPSSPTLIYVVEPRPFFETLSFLYEVSGYRYWGVYGLDNPKTIFEPYGTDFQKIYSEGIAREVSNNRNLRKEFNTANLDIHSLIPEGILSITQTTGMVGSSIIFYNNKEYVNSNNWTLAEAVKWYIPLSMGKHDPTLIDAIERSGLYNDFDSNSIHDASLAIKQKIDAEINKAYTISSDGGYDAVSLYNFLYYVIPNGSGICPIM